MLMSDSSYMTAVGGGTGTCEEKWIPFSKLITSLQASQGNAHDGGKRLILLTEEILWNLGVFVLSWSDYSHLALF